MVKLRDGLQLAPIINVDAYPAPHWPAATAGGATGAASNPDITCATSTTAWATL